MRTHRLANNVMAFQQCNDEGLRELALFAGAGGGILGGNLLGWRTVCAVERDAYAAQVLAQRQNDGILEAFPIWSDVCSFDGKPWRGIVDVISGGFPCQDISAAGKGAGIEGERSGLWTEFARIIGEVMPNYVYVENSPMLTIRGLGTVLRDLAKMGFDAQWGVLSARECGGVHLRERCWIVGKYAQRNRYIIKRNSKALQSEQKNKRSTLNKQNRDRIASEIEPTTEGSINSNNRRKRIQGQQQRPIYRFTRFPWGEDVRGIADLQHRSDIPQPLIRRIGDDVACGVDRLKAIGNGQVPRVAATAFNFLRARKLK